MFLVLIMSRGLSTGCPYTYPEWQIFILTLDNRSFSVMWHDTQAQEDLVVGGEVGEGRGASVQKMLRGLLDHYEVSIHRIKITDMFLRTALLVASNWSATRTESLDSTTVELPQRERAQESNKYNPTGSASILWCPHLLYTQQPTAFCLSLSVSRPFSFTTFQCLWLPSAPLTIFLQNFLFTLGLFSHPGSVLDKWEIPVVWQEKEEGVWLFTIGLCAFKVFKSSRLREHAFAFWRSGDGTGLGEKSMSRKDNFKIPRSAGDSQTWLCIRITQRAFKYAKSLRPRLNPQNQNPWGWTTGIWITAKF